MPVLPWHTCKVLHYLAAIARSWSASQPHLGCPKCSIPSNDGLFEEKTSNILIDCRFLPHVHRAGDGKEDDVYASAAFL